MPNWKDNGRTVLLISGRVAMWQRHWQPRRISLPHKDLRCMEYFANPGKVGKELDGTVLELSAFNSVGVRMCSRVPRGLPRQARAHSFHGVKVYFRSGFVPAVKFRLRRPS